MQKAGEAKTVVLSDASGLLLYPMVPGDGIIGWVNAVGEEVTGFRSTRPATGWTPLSGLPPVLIHDL